MKKKEKIALRVKRMLAALAAAVLLLEAAPLSSVRAGEIRKNDIYMEQAGRDMQIRQNTEKDRESEISEEGQKKGTDKEKKEQDSVDAGRTASGQKPEETAPDQAPVAPGQKPEETAPDQAPVAPGQEPEKTAPDQAPVAPGQKPEETAPNLAREDNDQKPKETAPDLQQENTGGRQKPEETEPDLQQEAAQKGETAEDRETGADRGDEQESAVPVRSENGDTSDGEKEVFNGSRSMKQEKDEKAVTEGSVRSGTVAGKSGTALVNENEKPVIDVRISDPDGRQIYACSTQDAAGENPQGISACYRTLQAAVHVLERPAGDGTAGDKDGYSGIRLAAWTLAAPGTDAKTAKKTRKNLVMNEAPADSMELYRDNKYRSCTAQISPEELVEKLAAKAEGYEHSGEYNLYIWAVDFCGNGDEEPLVIPICLDASAPAVTIRMDNGRKYGDQYYYRADNDEDPANDQKTPAITIEAAEDRKEGEVGFLSASLKGSVTEKTLTKEASGPSRNLLVFSVEDLKRHFGDTEEEIVITVSAADDLGNRTNCIEDKKSAGVRLKKGVDGKITSASLIRDASAPVITITFDSAQNKEIHLYKGKKGGEENGFTAYSPAALTAVFEVRDAYAADGGLFWGVPETDRQGGVLMPGSRKEVILNAGDGEEKAFACSAFGRDTAGNPATVIEKILQNSDIKKHPADMPVKEAYEQKGCSREGDHVPVCSIVVDRKAPEIILTYRVEEKHNPGRTAFIYDDDTDADNILTAYISGAVTAGAILQEDEENVDLSRLHYKNPGQEEACWDRAAITYIQSDQGKRYPAIELAPAGADGQYLYRVYGTDKAGNPANVTEKFDEDSRLELRYTAGKETTARRKGVTEDSAPYYKIIIDTAAPLVTKIITKDLLSGEEDKPGEGAESKPFYYNDNKTFYYNKDGIRTRVTISEVNFDPQRMKAAWKRNGTAEEPDTEVLGAEEPSSEEQDTDAGDHEIAVTFHEEGIYEKISLCGTDRAGNHVAAAAGAGREAWESGQSPEGPGTDPGEDPAADASDRTVTQNCARTVVSKDNGGRDLYGFDDTRVELCCPRILDRQSPLAEITYCIPEKTTGFLYQEKENGSRAAVYCKKPVRIKMKVSDSFGKGKEAKVSLLDGRKLEIRTLFSRQGHTYQASAPGKWPEYPENALPFSAEVTTDPEGRYMFSVRGTDRAGNPIEVRERLQTDPAQSALIRRVEGTEGDKGSEASGGSEGSKGEKGAEGSEGTVGSGPAAEETEQITRTGLNETASSFYMIVYDKTPPLYRLSMEAPPCPEESIDEETGIAYYGKSSSVIRAEYIVTEQNFDDTRLLAGIAKKSASGRDRMEDLDLSWTEPSVKGRRHEKDGLVTTVFSLETAVDKQHEGVCRFEIGGCDKAGNYLVPDPVQKKRDRSGKTEDLVMKTLAQDAQKGQYWTLRKAIDVTAPTGLLKVSTAGTGGDDYYELRFEPGGNVPVKYAPYRRETRAWVRIESADRSPTMVSCCLRSRDPDLDASYRSANPVTGGGKKTFCSDSTLHMTVQGEQVFYLENIVIKDRAGNIRNNGDLYSGEKITLARSRNIYLDATAPAVSGIADVEAPQVRIVASGSFTRHEADGERYIYRPEGSSLDLEVSVSDPGGSGRSSGLKKVEVEVRVGDRILTDRVKMEGLPYSGQQTDAAIPDRETLVYDIKNARIRIPTGSFAESNDITVTVRAWDNSGNSSSPSLDGGLLKLGIDTTPPRVEVNYHDTVEPRHEKYFKADRNVEIVVIDRNVENSRIRIDTNAEVPHDFAPPHGNRTSDHGGESGNEDRWTKTVLYNKDGDYTLQISGTDALGNRISGISWNGPAPNAFTIDKTLPVIRIVLPKEVNRQGDTKYYDSAAAARVEILEHNFFQEREKSLLSVHITASAHSGAPVPKAPVHSRFMSTGTDLHISTAVCEKDGDYEITASYTDMAGNEAVVEGGEGRKSMHTAWSGRFTVDTLAPELRIDPGTFRVEPLTGRPLQGLEKQIYTEKSFAPRVIVKDANYDHARSGFRVRAYGTKWTEKDRILKEGSDQTGEYSIRFRNFEMDRGLDGVYKVTASAKDLAGHESTLAFAFSLNRFGSTYVYADALTEEIMEDYYIRRTQDPIRILELSPVELKTHRVERFKDHEERTLKEGDQYTFRTSEGTAGTGKDSEGHRIYEYSIAPSVFEEEGVYDFILSSTDAAGNESSTALVREGTQQDGERTIAKFPIEFQVDKTVPVNRITGLEKGRERFNAEKLEFTLYPEDYQTGIREVTVRILESRILGSQIRDSRILDSQILDSEVRNRRIQDSRTQDSRVQSSRIQDSQTRNSRIREKDKKENDPSRMDGFYCCYRKIGAEEDRKSLAEKGIYPIEDLDKGIPILLEEKNCWQYLEVIATDLAGNRSRDCGIAEGEKGIEDTRRRLLVTTNPLVRLCSRGAALWGPVAVLAFLLLAVFLKKHRKRTFAEAEDA